MTAEANLACLLQRPANEHPSRTAAVIGEHVVDYATLDLGARLFAAALGELGVRPGQHVALLLPNVPQFCVAYFGAHYAGAPVVPLNVLLSAKELAFQLADSEAVALIVWETFLGTAQEAAAQAGSVRHLVVTRADLADASAPRGWHSLVTLLGAAEPVTDPHATVPDDTAVVLYTSGTTGRPKGAELSHANLLANARAAAAAVSLERHTVALAALPLFHAFGMTVMQNAVLGVGGTLVLHPRFEPDEALALMERHGVTLFGGVPTMFVALLEAATPASDLAALRWCVCGGAPMPEPVMAAFEARFGVPVLEGYGLSEASPVVSFTVPNRPRTPGSVGYPLTGVELRLLDDAGAVVAAPDTPGELCVRGSSVMKGYWHDQAATDAAIVDGWLRTGDIAMRDTDGAYRIVDRKKDIIIRGGYNVYPGEIERVLCQHPAVAQVAVVGVPHPRYGEEVKAVVALKPGRAATPTEIITFCRSHLAAYKYPRLVELCDRLPLGPTGKVVKTALRPQ